MLAPGKPVRTAVLLPMVNDATALPHVGSGSLDGHDHSAHIDGQNAVEIFHAVFQYAALDQHAGIDHEDVEATELLHGFRHSVAQLGLIRAVRLDGDGAHAAGRHLLHQFIRLVRRGGVGQGDAGAIFRQAPRDAGTDAARATDDQCDLVFQGLQCFCHGKSSVLE
jgi:hypothetical protein